MKLVRINNFKLEVDDELLLLKPFKELYKQDRSSNKDKFMEFLSILYYTFDPRSDFNYISNESERLEEVCAANGFQVPKFSDKEKVCIELYKQMTKTMSSMLLEDTRATIDKVRQMLKSIDLTILEEKDKINAIKTIATTASIIPKLLKDLSESEKIVTKELEESGRLRGNGSKKLFEDGIML